MELITEMFTAIKDLIVEIWGAIMEVLPIALKFIFWVLLGIIVLPCVFVAGNIYPWWLDWGEKTF